MAYIPSEDEAQQGPAAPVATPPHADVAGIISSLPLDTRWPSFTLRQYAGFWLPEAILKDGVPAIHSRFEPRHTDVFLASFPKSGTTWLKALAFATVTRATHPPRDADHPLRHGSPHDCVRFFESEISTGAEEFEAMPSPRVLATHIPYTLLPARITGDGEGEGEGEGCRIVYLCRDPKDVLVSAWFFTRKTAAARGLDVQPFTIQAAFELFCEGRLPAGPQWLHALQYWKESVRRPDRVLFLRYEEMLLEPESHLKKLAKFLGCGFFDEEEDQGVVSAIVELCSLGKLKEMEVNRNGSTTTGIKNDSFFRKGVAGDWSNHLTPEMAQRLDEVVEEALQGSGLTFVSSAAATRSSC